MNPQISKSTNANFFPNSVGQLAKMPFPTTKTLLTKDLAVGRQLKKNLHTPTHTGGFFNLSGTKPNEIKHFKLLPSAEKDFLQTIPLLFEQLENTKVVFHNPDYVTEIFEAYQTVQAHVFLDWVKTFAIIRKSSRAKLLENVIQSTDEDFLSALRIFKIQSTKPKKKYEGQRQKIWETIEKHFSDKPFGSRDIEGITMINYITVSSHLRLFKEQGKLKRCKRIYGHLRFQLIKK